MDLVQDTASQGSYSAHHYHHKEQIKINDLNDNNLIEVRINNIHFNDLINNLIISVVLFFYLNLFYFLFLHTHTGNLLLKLNLPLDYYFKKGN